MATGAAACKPQIGTVFLSGTAAWHSFGEAMAGLWRFNLCYPRYPRYPQAESPRYRLGESQIGGTY
jgi:hypothetical protein